MSTTRETESHGVPSAFGSSLDDVVDEVLYVVDVVAGVEIELVAGT